MDVAKYRLDQLEKQAKLLQKDVLGLIKDRDIWNLEYMITEIRPYSRAWRSGHIKSLKRAIKALERENEMNTQK